MARSSYMQRMPLSAEYMTIVCNSLRQVPEGGNGRRLSFDALLPLLGLTASEVHAEFARVRAVLRYEEQTSRDLAVLRRVRVPRLSCRAQSALTHGSRLA